MPFDPNLSYPSNPYKRGERGRLALARFPQVLANYFKLNAYYRGPGTLTSLQKHLVPAEMLSYKICTCLFPCHLTQIYLPRQTVINRGKGQALWSLVFRKFWPISSNLTHIIECPGPEANCRSIWFSLKCSQIKFVHVFFHAIWPKFMLPPKPLLKGW